MSTARSAAAAAVVLAALAIAPAARAGTSDVPLAASAVWPGDVAPQTARWRVSEYRYDAGLRVLRRPSPDRIVLADPGYRWAGRRGHPVRRIARSCAHIEVRGFLMPGPADAMALARSLMPGATLELYAGDSGGTAPVNGSPHPDVMAAVQREVAHPRTGSVLGLAEVEDFAHAGRHGLEAIRVRSTVLHASGGCAPKRWKANRAVDKASQLFSGG